MLEIYEIENDNKFEKYEIIMNGRDRFTLENEEVNCGMLGSDFSYILKNSLSEETILYREYKELNNDYVNEKYYNGKYKNLVSYLMNIGLLPKFNWLKNRNLDVIFD